MNRKTLLVLLSITPGMGWASANLSASVSYHPEAQLAKVLMIMMGFILCIVALGLVARKMMAQLGIKTDELKVLASIPLGTREKILLVKVGQKQYLVGATSYHIQTLCEVEEKLEGLSETDSPLNFKKLFEQVKAK